MKDGQSFLGWLRWDAKYIPRDIWEGIKNIFKWLPIIWKDRDWDHAYIMYALRFKINNIANYIEKWDRYIGCERDVERMRLCVKLMDKLEEDFYELEYQDYYETVFDFEKNERGLSELKGNIVRDDLKDYFKKYPNDYRRVSEEHKVEDIHAALIIGMNRHKRANRLLFTLIERNIEQWWD